MLEFNPSEQEKKRVSSSFFSCLAKIEEAAQAIESLHSLLEGEHLAVEAESIKALSQQTERISSCCFRLKVQKVRVEKVGRVMKPDRSMGEMQECGGGAKLDERLDWF